MLLKKIMSYVLSLSVMCSISAATSANADEYIPAASAPALSDLEDTLITESLTPPDTIAAPPMSVSSGIIESGFDITTTYDDYGYINLDAFENAYYMKALYNQLLDTFTELWNDPSDITATTVHYASGDKDEYLYGDIHFDGYYLTKDELSAVYSLFHYDHPIFFFDQGFTMSGFAGYFTSMKIMVSEDYINGSTRQAFQQEIIDGIPAFTEAVQSKSSDYEKGLAIQTLITDKIDYSYQEDGTANKAKWAHNVLGYFSDYNEGVCECYAKTFHLAAAMCDIDAVYVVSSSHAWNMMRADDGNYYYLDATWDDERTQPKYFCCGTDTLGTDESHVPLTTEGTGMYYLYDLPYVGTDDYIPSTVIPETTTSTSTTTTTTTATTSTTTTATSTTATETSTTATAASTTTTETSTTTTSASTTTTETSTTTTAASTTTAETSTTTTTATTPEPTETTPVLPGDADGNGIINLADAVAILSYIADNDKYPLTEQHLEAADVYNHGDGINASDAIAIQMYLLGSIYSL